ncbi:hypothetical protein CWI39_1392p0010 [Hamiltosporidium magnivora]|uniref:Uncharacterized protein n=1 Tax=Hamiltosporidium magnivora TaxID=148818 RepID=A0A4Q9L311_9MICR|nr:hypothetical protein CWI39_1392p0010 [Hamiltosporidium magnivora]
MQEFSEERIRALVFLRKKEGKRGCENYRIDRMAENNEVLKLHYPAKRNDNLVDNEVMAVPKLTLTETTKASINRKNNMRIEKMSTDRNVSQIFKTYHESKEEADPENNG